MKKILILSSKKSENKEKFIVYLKKYFGGGAEVSLKTFSEISIELQEDSVNVLIGDSDIRNFNLVYFRGTIGFMGRIKTLALALDFLKIKYIDAVWGKASVLGDKLTSLTRLALRGFPIIPSLFTSVENKKRITDFALKVGFPVIAKELTSQRLEGVYVINGFEDLKKLPELKPNNRPAEYLFQKFIDIENEYRLVVLGDRIGVAHTKVKRSYTGKKVRDLDDNSRIEFIDSGKLGELNKIAVKSAKTLNLEIAGVDMAIEKGTKKPWIVEVNRGPGICYDTNSSPELYAFANYLEKRVR